jgi:hypothetical protein
MHSTHKAVGSIPSTKKKKKVYQRLHEIKGKCEEQRLERVKPFMTRAAEQIKHILVN